MNDYEIDSVTADRVNASNYDIEDIVAIIKGNEPVEDLTGA